MSVDSVGSVSVGFQNLKPPFDLHPLVSDVRDPPSTASYSDRVNFGLGGIGSGGFVKLSVGLDSPT